MTEVTPKLNVELITIIVEDGKVIDTPAEPNEPVAPTRSIAGVAKATPAN